eukprot:6302813-Karenia_brevis.AAC.1
MIIACIIIDTIVIIIIMKATGDTTNRGIIQETAGVSFYVLLINPLVTGACRCYGHYELL